MLSLTEIKQTIKLGKQFVTIEHSDAVEQPISGLVLRLTKEGFDIEKKFLATSKENLKKQIDTKLPIVIGITTKQVLTKSITDFKKEEVDASQSFPNINPEDFYIERLYTKQDCFITICRKKAVDNVIKDYQELGFQILSFFLGNSYINELVPFISNSEVFTTNRKAIFNEEELSFLHTTTEPTVENYTIGDEIVPSRYVIPLSQALYFLNTRSEIQSNTVNLNKNLLDTYIQNRYVKNGSIALLGILFLFLIINSIVFSNTFKQLETFKQREQLFSSQKGAIEQMETELHQKENFVNSIQKTGFSSSSLIVSLIVEKIPHTVSLTILKYQPLKKTVRLKKPILLKEGEISISGKTVDKDAFFTWIKEVSVLDSIGVVKVDDFQDISAKSALFQVSVILK